ncbi:MAG: hypothetical protein ACHQNE_01670 [Candidatus Kapaibacterium sp.]
MAYTTDIVYDTLEVRSRTRQRNRHMLFLLLFLCGTIIAAIGWFAEWEHLADRIVFFHYSVIITVVGHALQVIGAFGSLLTPDYVEGEEDA